MTADPKRYGRWLVIRVVAPVQRRTDGRFRARVSVRCVCGFEGTAFVEDLVGERSSGCRSNLCRVRHEMALEVKREAAALGTPAQRWRDVEAFNAWVDRWLREMPKRELQAQLNGEDEECG